jgi:hypothetical protein
LYNVRDRLSNLPLEPNPQQWVALTAAQTNAIWVANCIDEFDFNSAETYVFFASRAPHPTRGAFFSRLFKIQEEMNKLEKIIVDKYEDDFSRPLSKELRDYYVENGDRFRKEFLQDKKDLYKDRIREVAKDYIKIATNLNGSHIGLCLHMYVY